MENNNQITNEKLSRLIDITEDGKEGYINAAKDIKNDAARSSFLVFAEQRSAYTSQLKELIHQQNGEAPDNGGDSKGSLHRVWMDLKAVFTGGDTEAIINACITGEEAALKEYEAVLNDPLIPERFKPIILEQFNGIQHALTNIKSQIYK